MKKLLLTFFLLIGILANFSGCASMRSTFRPKEKLPTVWTQPPSLQEALAHLQRQASAMQSLATTNATLSVPGAAIPLSTSLYAERPQSLRIRGSATALTGQEVDMGSNSEMFWIWGKRLAERELYYARHDQFAASPARTAIPVDPSWLMEALGFINFDRESYDPPRMIDAQSCEIIARRQTPAGVLIKRITFDARSGVLLRQEIYDAQNKLLAVAEASGHRIDKNTGIVFPQRVDVQCQGATGKMTIDLGTPTFNSPSAIPHGIFTKPTMPGYTDVDIAAPAFGNPANHAAPQANVSPPQVSPAPPQIASGQTFTVVQ